jgi:hypothetical protein
VPAARADVETGCSSIPFSLSSVEFLHEMKREYEALGAAGRAKTEHGITRQNMSALAEQWATRWLLDVQPLISRDRFRDL